MIKNKKLRIAIASVIMALIYPLIFIIFFCFLKSSDGVDAAGSGIESFYIFIEAFVVSVVYFGISIKFSRAFLHTTNPPYIALLLLLLVFCISLIPGFIDSLLKNDIVYYEDGRIMQKGKKK